MENVLVIHGEKSYRDGKIHREFVARLEKGLALSRKINFAQIIILGGRTRKNTMTEASQGRAFLKDKTNIPIVAEEYSRSTSENVRCAKEILLTENKPRKIYVVSSRKRDTRIKYFYKKFFGNAESNLTFVFSPAEDSYFPFFPFLEKIYFLLAMTDPYEKTFAKLGKSLFRNAQEDLNAP